MTPIQNFLTQAELTAKAQRLAQLQERIDSDTAEADAIKAEIRAGVPGPDSYAAGGLEVVVQPNKRFKPDKALPLIPTDLRPMLVTQVDQVDSARLKVLLPDVYEAATDYYDHKVSVR